MYVKLSLFFVLFGGFIQLNEAQTTNCSNTCMLRARCNPYYKDLVWTVVDRVCRVFQNGCIFGNENCMRANQCLPPMVATTREKCMESCPRMCSRGAPPVCGWFPYTDSNGNTGGRFKTFRSRCLLDLYACRNAEAYVNEPQIGPCTSES
ncbi:salivary glue protein Sgs-5 isoform X1 [Drosophila eugracilis]|uniref:salivary glue protein Sgs-5 isoform X1 n=1 Tax=Drosophila eugracilis TaxID=29029 RepID=UPI0007E6718C|nr:salivary glue protein Sgs-5 isoform X1 [Drosophila eugracilis]